MSPLPPPPPDTPRWFPGPLPATRFVPGDGPHPVRSGALAPTPRPDDAHDRHELLVRGVDAFNHHHPWEAHELWEAAWHEAPPGDVERELLGALIQLAAAILTDHLGREAARDALRDRVVTRLAGLPGPVWRGVATSALQRAVATWRHGGPWPRIDLALSELRVVAGVLVDGRRVLAGRRPPSDRLAGLWELPGGKVEPGEDDAAALRRELREELGVDVVVGARLGAVRYPYPGRLVHLIAYACRGGPPDRSSSHDAIAWVGAEDLDTLRWAPADRPLLDAVRGALRESDQGLVPSAR